MYNALSRETQALRLFSNRTQHLASYPTHSRLSSTVQLRVVIHPTPTRTHTADGEVGASKRTGLRRIHVQGHPTHNTRSQER